MRRSLIAVLALLAVAAVLPARPAAAGWRINRQAARMARALRDRGVTARPAATLGRSVALRRSSTATLIAGAFAGSLPFPTLVNQGIGLGGLISGVVMRAKAARARNHAVAELATTALQQAKAGDGRLLAVVAARDGRGRLRYERVFRKAVKKGVMDSGTLGALSAANRTR